MNISKLNLKKIKWLIRHPGFKEKPLKTLTRMIQWEFVRLSGKPIKFIYDNGLNILLYPDDGVARLVYYFNYHEPIEFRLLEKLLSQEMICVDVGANIGMYTLFFAERTKQVFAFEPLTSAIQKLKRSIADNHLSNVVCIEKAVSFQNQRLALVQCEDSSRTYTTSEASDKNREYVDSVSLDNFFEVERIKRLDYLKIDAEGAEASILQGARKTIDKFRPCIQLEIAEKFSERQPAHQFSISRYLSELKYQMFKIDTRTNLLIPGISWNTIAIPIEKLAEFEQKDLLKN